MKESLWLGMYTQSSGFNQLQFNWLSNTVPTYTNWAYKEPSTQSGKCVSFHVKDSGFISAGQWKMTNCNYRSGYFCKKKATLTNQITSTKSNAGCPPVKIIKLISMLND